MFKVKKEPKAIIKIAFGWFKKAIEDYHLLEDGEKVLVAVSGGKDSLCLIHLFNEYNKRKKKNWQILACHINPGFANWPKEQVEKRLRDLGVSYIVKSLPIGEKVKKIGEDFCFFCSRERKKALFTVAEENKINKIALAHHREDVNETFFLNLLFAAEISTFVPKQDFFGGKFYIIRPLYLFTEEIIASYLKVFSIKPIRNPCPYAQLSERERIRRILISYYRRDPRIRDNIFWGIKNIKTHYLP
ncbi:MAG: ATP-binding protein [candidate division WOR-3 bacterium]